MAPFSFLESSASALDDDAVRDLLAQQERWMVERKREVEIADVAKEVASFANSDGGWLLIGVHDSDGPEGARFEAVMPKLRGAPQHWLGQKLPKWLDPLPAFDAVTWTLGEDEIVVVRVWRSERAPIVHTGQGVIYERAPDGAVPIRSQDRVRELTARREQAVADAIQRLDNPRALPALFARLHVPPQQGTVSRGPAFVTRVTPLALVEKAFEPLALSSASFNEAPHQTTDLLLRLGATDFGNWRDTVRGSQPKRRTFQRGFCASHEVSLDFGQGALRWAVTYAADAGGALGIRLARPRPKKPITASELREEWLLPGVRLLAEKLAAAYTPGTVRFDFWAVGLDGFELEWDTERPTALEGPTVGRFGRDGARTWVQASHDLDLPAGPGDIEEVASAWTRGLAREAGITVPEGATVRETLSVSR